MPRDMTGTGRFPPQPKFKPISFYSSVRLGNPEQLAEVMRTDPYFVTQDNGAGSPLHFATTYKQLDMVRLQTEETCFGYSASVPTLRVFCLGKDQNDHLCQTGDVSSISDGLERAGCRLDDY